MLGQQLRTLHKETNKTTEKRYTCGYGQIVTHQKTLLGRVLKLSFINLDHNKFSEDTMQINHNEELSILSNSSPLPDQFSEWNVSCWECFC